VNDIDMKAVAVSGLLPPHYLSIEPLEEIRAYVNDYLKEEIVAEALTANLPAFAEFLRVVALTNSELLNYTNVASETGVSAKSVRSYFEILEDTLLGFRLEPWTRSRKRRMIRTEKFYLFDVGIANYLARRAPQPGTPEFGKSFEHYILMELVAFRSYRAPDMEIRYWRTSTGREVDFIVNDKEFAIEVKSSPRVPDAKIRDLTALAEDGPVQRRLVICMERQRRELRDAYGAITLMPWKEFLAELWDGNLIRI
jgi:predicted AAA+ superfamily ATPase